MGSISGLKSILLLVDLCTCRISGQNQNLNMIYSRRFLVYTYKFVYVFWSQQVLWRRCRGLDNSPLVIVLSTFVYVLVVNSKCEGQSLNSKS